MENNKTLRSKYSSKFENIYKSTKVNDGGKIKYKKYNFEPEYIYDEIDDILVIYFSNLEEYFNLKDKILYSTDFTKIFKLNKLKKFLDSNNSKKEKTTKRMPRTGIEPVTLRSSVLRSPN